MEDKITDQHQGFRPGNTTKGWVIRGLIEVAIAYIRVNYAFVTNVREFTGPFWGGRVLGERDPRGKGPEWDHVTLIQPEGTDGVKQLHLQPPRRASPRVRLGEARGAYSCPIPASRWASPLVTLVSPKWGPTQIDRASPRLGEPI
eukprot:1158900-Pelagomonas_calceolata.AAC.4